MTGPGSARWIRGVVVPQVHQFDELFRTRVFPAFADPEAQAQRVADDHYQRRMSEPVDEDGPVDPRPPLSPLNARHARRSEAGPR